MIHDWDLLENSLCKEEICRSKDETKLAIMFIIIKQVMDGWDFLLLVFLLFWCVEVFQTIKGKQKIVLLFENLLGLFCSHKR